MEQALMGRMPKPKPGEKQAQPVTRGDVKNAVGGVAAKRTLFPEALKITLYHGDLFKIKCEAIFMKHIEGTMSVPERALDALVQGKLQSLHDANEKADHSILIASPKGPLKCLVYVVNFHEKDLPFSYHSVDRYAKTIVRVAANPRIVATTGVTRVATALHGPGSGLDASEAMETLIGGFASELQTTPRGSLAEIILVENNKEIFVRLQERLRYLASKNIVKFDHGNCLINPEFSKSAGGIEAQRISRLGLKHLFIAMPFAKEFDNAYYFGIKQPVEHHERKCERVDQDAFTGDIIERVKRRISDCELVIADITGNNPNVFYELGYADGAGKRVIVISQEQDTPFDLKTRRQIRYKPHDILSLAKAIDEQLHELLEPIAH
jgi:hypothetical protein